MALFVMICLALSAGVASAQIDNNGNASEARASAHDLSRAFRAAAKEIAPSVVNVESNYEPTADDAKKNPQPQLQIPDPLREFFGEDFFERFFQQPGPGVPHPFQRKGIGSGVIVSDDGYILTNNHVVDGFNDVKVTLEDGRKFEAEIVGTDEKTDIAVLKIEAEDLTPAALGNQDELEVGDWVLAVGSPFGLTQTVTSGIVSAKGRVNIGITDYEDFIQTDAAINPGNSGGPLVNLEGEVVGINTAIATRTGGYMGIGFAIPVNMARNIMDQIIEKGRVVRGWLGVEIRPIESEYMAEQFDFEGTDGILVSAVFPDSPADKAGFQMGDIIVEYDGEEMTDVHELRQAVANTAPGTEVDVKISRDGKLKTIELAIGELDAEETAAATGEGKELPMQLGLAVRTLTEEDAVRLDLDDDVQGVLVTGVVPGSLAHQERIKVNDVIIRVGDREVSNVREFRDAVAEYDIEKGIPMTIISEGRQRMVFPKER